MKRFFKGAGRHIFDYSPLPPCHLTQGYPNIKETLRRFQLIDDIFWLITVVVLIDDAKRTLSKSLYFRLMHEIEIQARCAQSVQNTMNSAGCSCSELL